jgi:DNA-binding Lrp family transcriptional regulator
LDIKDKKILALLDENARCSNAQIARTVKLSKPTIEYRIQRLIKSGVIHQFYAVIDFTKLGYSNYKIYFRFQNVSLKDEERIIDYWVGADNSVWVGKIRGGWDLAVSIIAKSNFEFSKILNKFMSKYSEFILKKDILLTEYSPIYARKYLADTNPSEFVYGIPSELIELDETDKLILKELARNARINMSDLAEKVKLSRDVINYRVKKLTRERVIVQYRCFLNLPSIDIDYYKVIFRTKNFNEEAENTFKNYVKNHKKATQFLKLIGSWDVEVEFETDREDELYNILLDMRKRFSENIRDFEIIKIVHTYKYTFFPF